MNRFINEIYLDLKKVITVGRPYDKQEQLRIKKDLEENLIAEVEYQINLKDIRKMQKLIKEEQSQKRFDRFGGKNDKRRHSRNFNKSRK